MSRCCLPALVIILSALAILEITNTGKWSNIDFNPLVLGAYEKVTGLIKHV